MLISEAWSMSEVASRVGSALTALTLLKFLVFMGLKVDEDVEDLRRSVLEIEPVLRGLLDDAKRIVKIRGSPPPLLRAIQDEYGYADMKRIIDRLDNAIAVLERIKKGEYRREDFEELERILECIAEEALKTSRELISRARIVTTL